MNSKWYLYQCPQNRRSSWICHPKTWWSFNYKAFKLSIAVPCKNSLFLKFSGNDHILLLSSFFHWWPNISGFWNVSDTVLSFYRTLIAKLRLKGHVFSVIGIWPCNLPSFEPGNIRFALWFLPQVGSVEARAWDRDFVHSAYCRCAVSRKNYKPVGGCRIEKERSWVGMLLLPLVGGSGAHTSPRSSLPFRQGCHPSIPPCPSVRQPWVWADDSCGWGHSPLLRDHLWAKDN